MQILCAKNSENFRQTVTVSTTNLLANLGKSGDILGILGCMIKQKLFNTAKTHSFKMGGSI